MTDHGQSRNRPLVGSRDLKAHRRRRTMLQGRLAEPECTLGTDPRADPAIGAATAPFGLDGISPAPPLGPDSPRDALLGWCMVAEENFQGVFTALTQGITPV